jgi:hypothetical protein
MRASRFSAVLLSMACAANAAPPGTASFTGAVVDSHGRLAPHLQVALAEAGRRLTDAGCQQLLAEFHDMSGHVLAHRLDELELSAPRFLALLAFHDGSGDPVCASSKVLAATYPGSREVVLCSQFAELSRRDRQLAAAIFIHEALHSLGLSENPPTSREITARVIERCWR